MSALPTTLRLASGGVAALASGGAGYSLTTADWSTSTPVPAVLATGAVLVAATVLASLLAHPWWGPIVVASAFTLGVSSPIAPEDPLWLVSLGVLAVPVVALVTVVNLLVVGARHRAARHPEGRRSA